MTYEDALDIAKSCAEDQTHRHVWAKVAKILAAEVQRLRDETTRELQLTEVVQKHCADLERCLPVLRKYGLDSTTTQVELAIAELRGALRTSEEPKQ